MKTVKISKQMDNYHCSVYEDGKYTGTGAICYSKEQAEKYKEQVLTNGAPDLSVEAKAPETEDAPAVEEDVDGQMSFL